MTTKKERLGQIVFEGEVPDAILPEKKGWPSTELRVWVIRGGNDELNIVVIGLGDEIDSVSADRVATLSNLEHYVLQLILGGHTIEQISGILDVSVNKVTSCSRLIKRRLGAKSRYQLFATAIRGGMKAIVSND